MQSPVKTRPRFQFTPSQVLVLGFAALILIGTVLLRLPIAHEPGYSFTWVDALFTSTSAVCVTGLIVVDTATHFSTFGELVILGLIQAGGLGIMTLSALILLLIGKRVGLQERLLMQEALGSFSIAGVVRLTRNIIITSFAIEAIGAALLTVRWLFQLPPGKAIYWGIFHSISAFNNAGFDVTTASLRPFAKDPWVLAVISLLIILGGIGFPVMEEVWRTRNWDRLSLHSRLAIKMTVGLLAVGTVLFLLTEWSNSQTFGALPWYHKVTNAFFAAVTPRTAGYESIMTGRLRDVSILLTIVLMFVGASPGGTGGGIKTTSFSMLMLMVRTVAMGKDEVEIMGRRIPRDLVDKAVVITAIALALTISVAGILMVTEGAVLADPESGITFSDVVFEVFSAFGTVGLSTGLTGLLSAAGKILITLTMFVGRVGPMTMAVALAQRKNVRSPIHYPEDRVMIG